MDKPKNTELLIRFNQHFMRYIHAIFGNIVVVFMRLQIFNKYSNCNISLIDMKIYDLCLNSYEVKYVRCFGASGQHKQYTMHSF